MCADCTAPLLNPPDDVRDAPSADAGWDALSWAERIAPQAWGHADPAEPWIVRQRALTFAAVVTGAAVGCVHTADETATVPVVAIPRAPGQLRCPVCAEPAVAHASVQPLACDRCGTNAGRRVAVVAGQALIVVAELCSACAGAALALPH